LVGVSVAATGGRRRFLDDFSGRKVGGRSGRNDSDAVTLRPNNLPRALTIFTALHGLGERPNARTSDFHKWLAGRCGA